MKIGIDCGHTQYRGSYDYGSVGIRNESDLTREVGSLVISKLKQLGHTVINCTVDTCSSLGDSLGRRVSVANSNKLDFYVSIHFNCFNTQAYGTEVFTYGAKKYKQANDILNNLVALGFTNRGIKDGSDLYVIGNTSCEAMLVEVCFCDNSKDMSIFNAEKVANAIVKGLTGQTVENNPIKSHRNVVVYGNDVDKRAAEYLNDWLNVNKKDSILAHKKDYKVGMGRSVYAVGGGLDDIKANVYLKGSDRFDTLKNVIKRIGL
ncbi:N-acetylmuramoyl-L-alanine amidase [Clostridium senegalense]|uniref:N-acetylmuramoyl-L-alanine amidase n=1 Tax=Clostridium senegalense TaxID=1465809 RepID=UPI001C118C7C|nr:N-acetylmuramoyl-L-alanine amidase [Clostridium senegalense]MBU5225265.1 N-acetylmuramoyl-L-alanine amidase [Clostridium senegalense]